MNRKSNLITISISLCAVMILTVFTHYIVTKNPDELSCSIDMNAAAIDVNSFDARGVTPLMQAAIDSDVGRTKLLLSQGADPNIRSGNSDFDYALNLAVLNVNGGGNNGMEVVRLLLENGADVNAQNSRKMAPIHFMMQITDADNRWRILKLLMAYGAQINAQNEDGSTMLHIAVTINDRDWISRLNYGIAWLTQVNKLNDENRDTINLSVPHDIYNCPETLDYGQILNYSLKDKRGRTPLDLAIQLGFVSVFGAESTEHSIRSKPIYIGNNFDTKAMDACKRNGLQLAVIRGDMQFVEALIDHGADLAHQDSKGFTALHYAVLNPDPVTYVSYLLSKKAPTNIANNDGQTPLSLISHIRSKFVRHQVGQMLIDAGATIVNKDETLITKVPKG